ncbi:DUF4245 domain-containing protein [Carbonactinospora thermoautotrophica]|nr:DUF4245 domain-containing protein [Carbonactinospora thermoautotrophica]
MTGRRWFRNSMLSLAVLGVFLFTFLFTAPQRNFGAARQADYESVLREARATAPYHVFAPRNLPPTWKITSVRYDRQANGDVLWHLGLRTPRGHEVGIEQSDGSRAEFIRQITMRGDRVSRTVLNGAIWQLRQRKMRMRDVRSLVRIQDDCTVVVTGGVPDFTELLFLARSLR